MYKTLIHLICNTFLYDDTEINETNLTDVLISVRSAKESGNQVNHDCAEVISDTANIRRRQLNFCCTGGQENYFRSEGWQ